MLYLNARITVLRTKLLQEKGYDEDMQHRPQEEVIKEADMSDEYMQPELEQ